MPTFRSGCTFDVSGSTTLNCGIIWKKHSSPPLPGARSVVPAMDGSGTAPIPAKYGQQDFGNAQHTGDPAVSAYDLRQFEALAEVGLEVATPEVRSTQGRADLLDTLLVVPCSGSKKGASVPDLPERRLADYLDLASVRLLEEGRDQAFARPRVSHRPKFPSSCHRHVFGSALRNARVPKPAPGGP